MAVQPQNLLFTTICLVFFMLLTGGSIVALHT
jgi:hypothetical protein